MLRFLTIMSLALIFSVGALAQTTAKACNDTGKIYAECSNQLDIGATLWQRNSLVNN